MTIREKLQPGESKIVKLPQQGVGGYTWHLQNNSAPDVVLVEQSKEQPEGSTLPGAAAYVWFTLTAQRRGVATVSFAFQRTWEMASPPAKMTTVVVKVA